MQQIDPRPSDPAEAAPGAPTRRMRSRPPFMTLALIGVNLLMAMAQVTASAGLTASSTLGTAPAKWALGARVSSLVAHGEYWRLVTANFLHGSPSHLFWNMLGLLLLGRLLESFYGPARLFVIFVLGAAAGAAGSYLNTPGEALGASTGVMALLGALLVHNLKYRPYLPERVNRLFPFLTAFVVFTLLVNGGQTSVDFQGHLWGLFAGGLLAGLLESRVAGPLQEEREWLPLPTALATAAALLLYGGLGLLSALPGEMAMLRAGSSRSAQVRVANLRSVVEQRPYFLEGRCYLADTLTAAGRLDEGDRIYEDLLREQGRNPYVRERVALHSLTAGQLRDQAKQWEAAAAQYQRAADLFGEEHSEVRALADNAYAWTLADRLHQNLNEALRYALRAAEERPYDGAIVDTIAWIYYQQGKYSDALPQQERAVELWRKYGGGNPWAKILNRWLGEGEPGQSPDSGGELYFHLGAIQQKLGRTAEARAAYEQALQERPGYPEATAALRALTQPRTEPAGPGRELTPRLIVPKRDPVTTT